jgi:oleate hydratase
VPLQQWLIQKGVRCELGCRVTDLSLGFISQFVEIPDDVVFTVEYSLRAAQMAVYQLRGVKRPIPPVSRYDKTPKVLLQSLQTSFR